MDDAMESLEDQVNKNESMIISKIRQPRLSEVKDFPTLVSQPVSMLADLDEAAKKDRSYDCQGRGKPAILRGFRLFDLLERTT